MIRGEHSEVTMGYGWFVVSKPDEGTVELEYRPGCAALTGSVDRGVVLVGVDPWCAGGESCVRRG